MLSKLTLILLVSVELVAATNSSNGTNVTTTTTTADDVFIAGTTEEATTTAAPTTTAAATNATNQAKIVTGKLKIGLPEGVSAADFIADSKVKTAIIASIAEITQAQPAWVEITKLEVVNSTSRRLLDRRLAGASINVEYRITVPGQFASAITPAHLDSIASAGADFVSKINAKLAAAGSSFTIASCVPSKPTATVVQITTTGAPTTTAASGSGGTTKAPAPGATDGARRSSWLLAPAAAAAALWAAVA